MLWRRSCDQSLLVLTVVGYQDLVQLLKASYHKILNRSVI